SGIWRDIPPGRQWVPGYWSEVERGFQWTSGFWAPVDQEEIEYLPTPPASQEVGPNTPAPSQSHVWTPGYWVWHEEHYAWTPGYWIESQPSWVWVPPTYIATPSGCVFVPGYWDYTLASRGLIFAPVVIQPVVYTRPNFVYTPTVTIDSYVLTDHFFCRPSYRHYYFGDYYAAAPARQIVPWHAFQQSRTWYDPIYVHQRVVSVRSDPTWETRVRETYQYRVEHVDARPARTFRAQQAFVAQHQDAGARQLVLARTLTQVGRQEHARIRLEQVDQVRRAEVVRQQQGLQRLREQRVRQEVEARTRREATKEQVVVRRREMLRSPVAARVRPDGPPDARPFARPRPGDGPGPRPGPRIRAAEPGPDLPRRPRPERAEVQAAPRPFPPRPDLAPDRPRDLPKAERLRTPPRLDTTAPGLDRPGALPKRERPRDLPQFERPRPQPRLDAPPPGLNLPGAQPKRERPRDLPKAERPAPQPGGAPFGPGPGRPQPPRPAPDRPQAQPKRERPQRPGA
ncbi:MAG TPA: hypothetical protein VF590_16120, partial [Isosphaeraceae bacterium]